VIRPFVLVSALLPLCAGIVLLWQHRFKREGNRFEVTLENLVPVSTRAKQLVRDNEPGAVIMKAAPHGAGQVALFDFPPQMPPEFLYVRLRVLSKNLHPDSGSWQNGRTIIEWHDPRGIESVVFLPIQCAEYDSLDEPPPFVVKSAFPGAVPRLRIEHLGRDGTYQVEKLALLPVGESGFWRFGGPLLVFCWLAWVVVLCRKNKKPALWRGFLAGVVFIAMGFYLVVPGPWKVIRPLGFEFNLDENGHDIPNEATSSTGEAMNLKHTPHAPEPLGKMDVQGGLLIKIKLYLSMIRPLLHGVLFLGPAFLLAWLVGKKSSIMLLVMIIFGIETL